MTRLSGPMLPPMTGAAPGSLVVLLHGYGSDGADMIGLGQAWRPRFPATAFLAPNGPAVCAINPGGYEWFALDLEDRSSRIAGARAGAPVIEGFLRDLWAQSGLGPAETVLGGFSQGAMMALHVGLGLPERLAGIVAFSGALVPPAAYGPELPPVLLVHGEDDGVVDPAESRSAAAALDDMGCEVTLEVFPDLAHGISPEALGVATAFLRGVLPD